MGSQTSVDTPGSGTRSRIKLTGEQRQIIRSSAHTGQVQAFAGSAKTTTLALSVERDIKKGVPPEAILCLTFSKAACEAAKRRLPKGVQVSTFHSFSLTLAQRPGTRLKLLPDKEAEHLLGRAVKAEQKARKKRGRHRSTFLDQLVATPANKHLALQFFDLVRSGRQRPKRLVDDQALPFTVFASHLSSLRRVANRYWRELERHGLIDFSGMIKQGFRAVEQGLQVPFTHLYVDEYQDCTPAQARLVAALAPKMRRVRVFGDRFQTIYGFAGARFTDLASLIGGVKTFTLTKSFRLTEENAALASSVLAQYKGAGLPRIVGGRGSQERPTLRAYEHAHEQSPAVTELVGDLMARGAEPREIVILARTKAQLREQEQALLSAGIETLPLYRHRSSRHIRRVVRLARKLEALRTVGHLAQRERLRRLLSNLGPDGDMKKATLERHRRRLEGALGSTTFQSLFAECARTYLAVRKVRRGGADVDTAAAVNRWVALAGRYPSAEKFKKAQARAASSPHVRTCTIHQAKGGEWDHVILLNVVDGCMPYFRAFKSKSAIDEERNLFYVAITRARETLHLMQAPYANARSRTAYQEVSRFLEGMASTMECHSVSE